MHTALPNLRSRVRKGPFAELLAELNRNRTRLAEAEHDATISFGPTMRVERFVLGNGLRVLILQDNAAPVVCVQTWFGVGSRHERVGKTGIAHLFEHLMFGETETSAHGAFDRTLEEAGAETNAATFLDWTYYHTNLPAEALELTLRLEADRMSRLVLRDPQVASEKEVVANERRQRVDDDVDGAISEVLYKEAFREHGYGHPTIGWMDDILGFTTDDCVSFYRTYYAPNNAAMAIVGDVDIGQVLRLVQDNYGGLPPSVLPVEDVHPEPPQTVEHRIQITKPTPTHKVAIGYKSPALGDFDHPALVLLNEILFGGRSSRVHRALIQEQEIATDVRGWVGAFRDPSLYDVFLSARGEHTAEALCAALDVLLDRVRVEPVTEEELEKAKARVELAVLQGLETVSGKAEQIGFYEIVLGDPAALFERLAAYRRITVGDLLRVARRYLARSSRTVIEVAPDGSMESDEVDDEEAEGEGSEEEVAS
ncbi:MULTISPECIES: M16 family metallopeptidase [Polyangium]|uniref:Insulinase family protein n=2 Tax=Polyangium TaxID=55 RepID=A0A4U1J9F2_9BACT|nr:MULTISPECIES: pitrilysin family protein [Polyangium]MDI1434172.1 pitrilysin family protein [Polyangium sorediatum]TKD03258.1 insulinase family protein [Polyangium fumosum]